MVALDRLVSSESVLSFYNAAGYRYTPTLRQEAVELVACLAVFQLLMHGYVYVLA